MAVRWLAVLVTRLLASRSASAGTVFVLSDPSSLYAEVEFTLIDPGGARPEHLHGRSGQGRSR